jgi:hypothetical protein
MPVDGPFHDAGTLTDPPTFDLSYDIDEREDPTRLTVYSEASNETSTHWITVDMDHAVDTRDTV